MSSRGLPGTATTSQPGSRVLARRSGRPTAGAWRRLHRAGLDGGERGHAEFDHEDEFAGLGAVGEGADVRTHGDGNSGGECCFFELLGVVGDELLLERRGQRAGRDGDVSAKYSEMVKVGTAKILFFAHQARMVSSLS